MPDGIRLFTTQIRGAEWGLQSLPADTGGRLLTWLFRLAGEPVGRLGAEGMAARSRDSSSGEIDLDRVAALFEGRGDVLAAAIGALTRQLARPATMRNVQLLLTNLTRNQEAIEFRHYFSANYGELRDVTIWAIKENFKSFFDDPRLLAVLGSRLGSKPTQAPPSKVLRTSTG